MLCSLFEAHDLHGPLSSRIDASAMPRARTEVTLLAHTFNGIRSSTTPLALNETMRNQLPESRWELTHQCQGCGHVVRIDDIDAKLIATGVLTCQRCEASGPVNVKIVDAEQVSEPMQPLRGKRQ